MDIAWMVKEFLKGLIDRFQCGDVEEFETWDNHHTCGSNYDYNWKWSLINNRDLDSIKNGHTWNIP